MAANPTVYRATQIGPEVTPGVVVPATKRVLDLMFTGRPNIPRTMYRPAGSRVPTTNVAQKEFSSAAVEGRTNYRSLVYILCGLLKNVTPTTPSGATNARLWTFKPSSSSPETIKSFTVENGNAVQADRWSNARFNSLSMTWNRTDATLTSAMTGQEFVAGVTITPTPTDIAVAPVAPTDVSLFVGTSLATNQQQTITVSGTPTGGTFTLRWTDANHPQGIQTTAIAFDANAAAVTTALEALESIGLGNVTVTGGPGPGTPWVATFTGNLAAVQNRLLALGTNSLTGGTSPTVAVTQTQAASLARVTKASSIELAIPDLVDYNFTVNQADPSWSDAVDIGAEPTATVELQHDSESIAMINSLRDNETNYARILCRGREIETGFLQTLAITFPFKFNDVETLDANNVYSARFPLGLLHDDTFGGWIEAQVQNDVSSL